MRVETNESDCSADRQARRLSDRHFWDDGSTGDRRSAMQRILAWIMGWGWLQWLETALVMALLAALIYCGMNYAPLNPEKGVRGIRGVQGVTGTVPYFNDPNTERARMPSPCPDGETDCD